MNEEEELGFRSSAEKLKTTLESLQMKKQFYDNLVHT